MVFANNRIARTTGIRQQRRYDFCYPHRTGRFPRPIISYRNVPIHVLIVLMHDQISNHYQKWKHLTLLCSRLHSYEKHLHTPPKRTSKNRIIAKDADAKLKLKVISAIEACFNGYLAGRVSLASFEYPRQRPSPRGKW